MAIQKMTWNELMTNLPIATTLGESGTVSSCLTAVDTAFNTKYGVSTTLSNNFSVISNTFLTSNYPRRTWAKLPIYVSSYKLADGDSSGDLRIVYKIKDNLIRYATFFKKMITDEGLQRKLLTSKEYTHNNTSDSGDKNLYSETPQIELDNFENAIKYASNLSKSDLHNESEQTGDSTETVTSTSWDEGLRNLRFAFYNDLIDYINSIPNLIYSYYSLDSLPASELVKANREYLKTISNL